MTIQELGSIGELVGGVAVVLTFVFLALQIRQNSKLIRAQIMQSFADNTVSGNLTWATDPNMRRVLVKTSKDEPLTEEEEMALWGIVYSVIRLWENQYTQVQMGTIPKAYWDAQKSIATNKMYSDWLKEHWHEIKDEFYPDFVKELDSVIRNGP